MPFRDREIEERKNNKEKFENKKTQESEFKSCLKLIN